MMRDVRKVEATRQIYDSQCLKYEASKEVESIREAVDIFGSMEDETEIEKRQKARQLKEKVEAVIESLSHLLTLNQTDSKRLCTLLTKQHMQLSARAHQHALQ
jgi:uncharacterized protein YjgD (DUF1641 family)